LTTKKKEINKMIDEIVSAIQSEELFHRALKGDAYFFEVEVHLTKETLEELEKEVVVCSEGKKDKFMGYKLIEDTSNYICTVHKTELIL
jgi:hypothetical protein